MAHSKRIPYEEDGGRPRISAKKVSRQRNVHDGRRLCFAARKASTYRVGDSVHWAVPGSRGSVGPYTISRVTDAQQYTLCDSNGNNINDGQAVPEDQLMAA